MTDDTRRTVNTFLGSRDGENEPKASRGLLSIVTLIVAGGLIYTSVPYAGAFVNVGEVVGISKLDRRVGEMKSGITKSASVKKVYLRAGQGLLATYKLPKESGLELTVLQCKSRPIIEVYNCAPVSKQNIKIDEGSSGRRRFQAPQAGFYYFKDTLSSPTAVQTPYTLLWQRT